MSIRDTLLANVTTSLSGTSVSVSSELPWNSGQRPLYEKNMKHFYISEVSLDITQNQITLDRNDVFQTESTLTAFVSVDAKTQPTDISTVISAVLNSKNSVSDQYIMECNGTTEIVDDRITYQFDYRFVKIN
tara:strand:+ start:1344 stop:1739 length:396 start_codon:yes stop_codon:yes gene_type:complete